MKLITQPLKVNLVLVKEQIQCKIDGKQCIGEGVTAGTIIARSKLIIEKFGITLFFMAINIDTVYVSVQFLNLQSKK